MSTDDNLDKPARQFWVICIVALLWNLIGMATFLMTASLSPEALNAMSEEERALYSDIPLLITLSYGIAVFGGTLGCVLLALRKSLAVGFFAVSLVTICIQMGHALLFTPLLTIQGPTGAILPLMVVGVAGLLLWYALRARKQHWLS